MPCLYSKGLTSLCGSIKKPVYIAHHAYNYSLRQNSVIISASIEVNNSLQVLIHLWFDGSDDFLCNRTYCTVFIFDTHV